MTTRRLLLALFVATTALPAQAQQKEPEVMAARQLPKAIRALHGCASASDEVTISYDRFAKSVLFVVSCPARVGGHETLAVYVARDRRGRGARGVRFPALTPAGVPVVLDVLEQASPVREFGRDMIVKEDPPWINAAWWPHDRAGICRAFAQWRLDGEKAELMLWQEATECPSGGPMKFNVKVDRHPPALIGR